MKEGKRVSTSQRKITLIVVIEDDGSEHVFKDVVKFKHWFSEQGFSKAYAHNSGYDIGSVWHDELHLFDMTFVGGRLIKAVRFGTTFLDSMNIFPMSVKKLGEEVGLKKLDDAKRGIKYAKRDVQIIKRGIEGFRAKMQEYGIQPKNTLGGNAVELWKSRGGHNWFCCEDDFWQGYSGGRVELFVDAYEGKSSDWDGNSLYPFVCLNEFPDENIREYASMGVQYGMAKVSLDIPRQKIAPLPFRLETGGICYPTGKITGIWTVHEIRNAVQNAGAKLLKTHWCKGTDRGRCYYKHFVEMCYKARLASESDAYKLIYKLLMNSLYGTLGLKGTITRSVYLTEADVIDIDEDYYPCGLDLIGDKLLKDVQIPLPEHVNYLHAAYVTSYGRLYIDAAARAVSQRVLYIDTDGLNLKGWENPPFQIGTGLGEFKCVSKDDCKCEYQKPKQYRRGNIIKCKGIPKLHMQQYFENGYAEYFQPYRLKESLRYYMGEKHRRASWWRKIRKENKGNYDKKRLKSGEYFPLHFLGKESALKVSE